MSPLARQVIALLEDPKEVWSLGHYTAENDRLKISIWTSGIYFFDIEIYPEPIGLSLREKYKVYKALEVARRNLIARKISSPTLNAWTDDE